MDDDLITLKEIVEENEQIELEERTHRGQSHRDECTYDKGYLVRQGLYACQTCQQNGCSPAAICYGCSVNCHEGHELYELWSKRLYRCDCGNSKFKNTLTCQLQPLKEPLNVRNNYDSHNLVGRYCTCNDIFDGLQEMVGCVMCEDWFHWEHIGLRSNENNAEGDLVCPECSTKFNQILSPYYIESI